MSNRYGDPITPRWKPLSRSDSAAIWNRVARRRAAAGDHEGARIAREVARRYTGAARNDYQEKEQ